MEEPKEKPTPKRRFIHYTGVANVRKVTRAQWEKAGVEGQDEVVWDKSNGFKVPESSVKKDARDLLLAPDFRTRSE